MADAVASGAAIPRRKRWLHWSYQVWGCRPCRQWMAVRRSGGEMWGRWLPVAEVVAALNAANMSLRPGLQSPPCGQNGVGRKRPGHRGRARWRQQWRAVHRGPDAAGSAVPANGRTRLLLPEGAQSKLLPYQDEDQILWKAPDRVARAYDLSKAETVPQTGLPWLTATTGAANTHGFSRGTMTLQTCRRDHETPATPATGGSVYATRRPEWPIMP